MKKRFLSFLAVIVLVMVSGVPTAAVAGPLPRNYDTTDEGGDHGYVETPPLESLRHHGGRVLSTTLFGGAWLMYLLANFCSFWVSAIPGEKWEGVVALLTGLVLSIIGMLNFPWEWSWVFIVGVYITMVIPFLCYLVPGWKALNEEGGFTRLDDFALKGGLPAFLGLVAIFLVAGLAAALSSVS